MVQEWQWKKLVVLSRPKFTATIKMVRQNWIIIAKTVMFSKAWTVWIIIAKTVILQTAWSIRIISAETVVMFSAWAVWIIMEKKSVVAKPELRRTFHQGIKRIDLLQQTWKFEWLLQTPWCDSRNSDDTLATFHLGTQCIFSTKRETLESVWMRTWMNYNIKARIDVPKAAMMRELCPEKKVSWWNSSISLRIRLSED